jgi:hypothetical protein
LQGEHLVLWGERLALTLQGEHLDLGSHFDLWQLSPRRGLLEIKAASSA